MNEPTPRILRLHRHQMGRTVIARARIAPYCLRLRAPWSTSRGALTARRGWLIRLESSKGIAGFGDCAPLPEAGTESAIDARRTLRTCVTALPERTVFDALAGLREYVHAPAVRCAVESALLDLAARDAGRPLVQYLRPQAPLGVAVNASLGLVDDSLPMRARAALTAGYRVLKIKLGSAAFADELVRLQSLMRELPRGAVLRLDANGAWDESTARVAIRSLAALPVDALEEPLHAPDLAALKRLQDVAPWPLALDESLAHWSPARLLADPPVQRLVLKPMVAGGALRIMDLADKARAMGLSVVVTTTVDSAVGTWFALHLAAAIAGDGAHGLATSEWLRDDVGNAPVASGGHMKIGTGPGLDFLASKSIEFEDV